MTTDEVRAAAEAVAEMRNRPDDGALVIQISRHTWDTCLDVADGYLAANPPDDVQPTREEWDEYERGQARMSQGTEARPAREIDGPADRVVNECRAEPSWATLSDDGAYRYALGRRWAPVGKTCIWVMLNPSTADASQDDATIRRIRRFSADMDCGALIVVNLFAFRTAYPGELSAVRDHGLDVVGPENDDAIRAVLADRVDGISRVVFAWGNSFGKLPWFKSRIAAVRRMVAHAGLSPYCLGTTDSGEPRHPVRLPSATKCVPWSGYR